MDTLVSIYKNMEVSSGVNILVTQTQPQMSGISCVVIQGVEQHKVEMLLGRGCLYLMFMQWMHLNLDPQGVSLEVNFLG